MDEKLPEEISFGEWLHQHRRLLDLTQQQLADQIGCARITLRRIEAGALKPSKELALILLEKLGAPQADREAWLRFARGLAGFPGKPTDSFPRKRLTNLPTSLTSFIGREKEQQEIIELINKYHLVTLIGSGGVGKTRLSLKIGEEVLENYPDGVWLVELAPILDPFLVPRTTAIAIGLREEPKRPIIDMLCDYLRQKQMLLILDNCEHLIDAVASMANRLLRAADNLRILASSREALGIPGEISYLVPALKLPDTQQLPPLASLREFESVRLFIDRAISAVPTFTVTSENTLALAQICHRLDGIPLAIELAAAKIRVLSVEQIAERLDDRFRLLTGGNRTALERHQTLRAAIDWSYHLLSPAEQTLFRGLFVFVGGWTLEAVESICSEETVSNGASSDDILNLVEQLINKSLVIRQEARHEARYHMLETLRQYAGNKLAEFGDTNALRDRHLQYFLKLAETAAPHLIRSEQVEWLDRLEDDHDNLRAALEWSLSKERREQALRLAAALGTFWYMHSHWKEGAHWLESALAMAAQEPASFEKAARARVLYQDVLLADALDNIERMQDSAQAAFSLCQEGTDRLDLAISRYCMGFAFYRITDHENALPLLQQSLAEFQELKEPYWEALCQRRIWRIRLQRGEQSFAEVIARDLEIVRSTGERRLIATALEETFVYAWQNNQLEEANAYVEEADRINQQVGFKVSLAHLHGMIAHARRDYSKAKALYSEAIEIMELMGQKSTKGESLEYLGLIEKDEGNLSEAQTYLEQAVATAREIGQKGPIVYRLGVLGQIHVLQGKLDEAKRDFRESLVMGKVLHLRVVAISLVYVCSYLAYSAPRLAVPILSAIHSYEAREKSAVARDPFARGDFNAALAQARRALSKSGFQAAWKEGETLSIEEACDLALKALDDV